MSKRTLPVLPTVEARDRVSFDLPKSALAKWNQALQAKDGDATINIYDVIGRDEYGGVSAKRISSALRAIGERDVVVNVNSPGGDVFEGIAIYNILRAHPFNVTVRVVGLAASAASIIAMAGDEIQMGRAAFLMIHNVWVLAIGNRNDLRAVADMMEPIDDALADVYATRSGNDKDTVAEMMDKETWLNGSQSVDNGFADSVLAADEIDEKETEQEDKSAAAVARRIDAALLQGGTARPKRLALMNQLRGALSAAPATPSTTEKEPPMNQPDQPAAPATPAAPAATAAQPAAAPAPQPAAPAAADPKARIKAILALDEAKGRGKLANHLALETETGVDEAKSILAMSPKETRLDDAMNQYRTDVRSEEHPEQAPKPVDSAQAIYDRRKGIFAAGRTTQPR